MKSGKPRRRLSRYDSGGLRILKQAKAMGIKMAADVATRLMNWAGVHAVQNATREH